jgi:cell wall assembly regulator SMI1
MRHPGYVLDKLDRLIVALDRLVAAAVAQGSSIEEGLLPGIGEDQVRATLAPLGLVPPPEMISLFGWHNGHDDSAFGLVQLGPLVALPTLSRACELNELVREFLPMWVSVGDIEHADWFPVIDLREGGSVVMDCRPTSATFGHIFGYDFQSDIPEYMPASLAEPIERWAGYVEEGRWIRGDHDQWIDYRTDVTPESNFAQSNLP